MALAVAMPWAATEVEQYGYHHGQAVDLGPIMPATQFRVTDEVGTYLCAVWALVFEGSILAYNPTRDEVEWVPMCGVANDLSWTEEKLAMALAIMRHVFPKRGPALQGQGPLPCELA